MEAGSERGHMAYFENGGKGHKARKVKKGVLL